MMAAAELAWLIWSERIKQKQSLLHSEATCTDVVCTNC